jgi:hypothetical protein
MRRATWGSGVGTGGGHGMTWACWARSRASQRPDSWASAASGSMALAAGSRMRGHTPASPPLQRPQKTRPLRARDPVAPLHQAVRAQQGRQHTCITSLSMMHGPECQHVNVSQFELARWQHQESKPLEGVKWLVWKNLGGWIHSFIVQGWNRHRSKGHGVV